MAVYTYDSLKDWVNALDNNPELNGLSPGGVAAHLGITRQAIHTLVKRGKLDQVRVLDSGQLRMILITNESLKRYEANPSSVGRPPSLRGRLAMLKDQVKHRVHD